MEDKHYLLGTAGHVDHGKTELIRALTGIETDRLKEEKLRGISIELGFAHMTLPNGDSIGIVDVPGHEKFIRQMLSGASGIDAVLFVVAADEGMMPQSREHLEIISLLGIEAGIIVITKKDLVDEEWLDLVTEEIREEIKDSVLAKAPICSVSSRSGEGISELKNTIEHVIKQAQTKKTHGPFYMPIDRVFSVQGFGTVVTGTLHRGIIEVGQEIEVGPQGLLVKVRSLQVHGKKVSLAVAGQRTAVNISGIEVGQVDRGATLITPGAFEVGQIINVKIKHLTSSTKPIIHRQRIRFHLGTAEVLGRVHLLEEEEMPAGKESYAQILLEEPVVVVPRDKFVIRFYSPAFTIGGGRIIGIASRKHRRFKKEVIEELARKDKGDPSELIIDSLQSPMSINELVQTHKISLEDINKILAQLDKDQLIKKWDNEDGPVFWAKESYLKWQEKLLNHLRSYEKKYPLRLGIGREELKGLLQIKWPQRRWQLIIEGSEKDLYEVKGNKVMVKEPMPLPPKTKQALDCLYDQFTKRSLTPPDLEEVSKLCSIDKNIINEYIAFLIETDKILAIGGLYFSTKVINNAKEKLFVYLEKNTEISVSDVRELWNTTRKYAVPLLEYFDDIKFTRRVGDKRTLYK